MFNYEKEPWGYIYAKKERDEIKTLYEDLEMENKILRNELIKLGKNPDKIIEKNFVEKDLFDKKEMLENIFLEKSGRYFQSLTIYNEKGCDLNFFVKYCLEEIKKEENNENGRKKRILRAINRCLSEYEIIEENHLDLYSKHLNDFLKLADSKRLEFDIKNLISSLKFYRKNIKNN